MSGAHPYCIVPAGHAPAPELTGVDGCAVRARAVGSVAVWLSSAPEPFPNDVERIRQHHAVVQSAAAAVTPVPVRYGEWSPDEGALEESIRARAERFRQLLTTLSGRVEYGVSVGLDVYGQRSSPAFDRAPPVQGEPPGASGAPGEPPVGGSGRRYLHALAEAARSRRRARQGREALLATLRSRVTDIVAEERVTAGGEAGVVSVAHLVDREGHEHYLELVRDWAEEEAARYEVRIMGPWPPYSFARP